MKKRILFSFLLIASPSYGYDFTDGQNFVFTDLLVWKLREGSAENWSQTISAPGTTRSAFLNDAPFSWDAGVRVGVGRDSCDHLWNVSLAYTHYQTTDFRAVNAVSGGIDSANTGNFFANNPTGTGFGPSYQNANINWAFSFNTIDLMLSHTIPIDALLILRPILGIKGAIINQTMTSRWQNPTVPTTFTLATETLKNNFWGVGPSIGLESIWPIYKRATSCLSFNGKISGALMAGKWAFEDNYLNGTPNSVTVNMDDLFSAATMATGFLGIEWVGDFLNASATAKLGYEAQVWFNQLQYYDFNMGKLNHLMSLQGGILELYVNF